MRIKYLQPIIALQTSIPNGKRLLGRLMAGLNNGFYVSVERVQDAF